MKKICLALVILASIVLRGCNQQVKCFEDNAKFGLFDTEKTEMFIVRSDSFFEASFEGVIEGGNMVISIYSDTGIHIFDFEGNEFNENVSTELTEGTYYYYLKAENCTNGRFHNKGTIIEK